MHECPNLLNTELIETVKKLGKENCFIVTNGEQEFNHDKILRIGLQDLFYEQNIFIVLGSKKEIIEKICAKHKNEKVIFIDDKAKHFEDLDFTKCPNLKTILYTGQKLEGVLEL